MEDKILKEFDNFLTNRFKRLEALNADMSLKMYKKVILPMVIKERFKELWKTIPSKF